MCSVLLLNIVTTRGNISKDKTTFFLLDLRLEVVRSLQNLFYLLEYNEFKTMNRDTYWYYFLKIVHGIFMKQMISSHWTNLSIFNFCTIDQDNFKWKPRSLPFFVFFLHILFIKVLLNRKYYYRTITMNDSANWFLRRCL